MNSNKQRQVYILTLIGVMLLLLFFILKPFLVTLSFSAIFAVLLYPVYKKILHFTQGKELFSAWATVAISVICILGPLIFLGTQIFQESVHLYSSLTAGDNKQNMIIASIDSAGKIFEKWAPGTGSYFTTLSNNLDGYLKQGLSWLIEHVGVVLSSISVLALELFIFFMSFYYLLRDGGKVTALIIKLSPLNNKDDTIIFERLRQAINSVIKGSLLVALIQGVLTAIGFTLFGIPNSILWGTLTIFAALIPAVGTGLVLIPGVIFLFVTGSFLPAIGLSVWGVFAVGLIDNALKPKLIGNDLSVHPLLILLSVLGGIAFFGPAGLFLGPLAVSLLFAFISVYSHPSVNKA